MKQRVIKRRWSAAHQWAGWWCIGFGCLLAAGEPLLAATHQSHESIRQAVHDYLAAQTRSLGRATRIDVDELDPRLLVAACNRALSTFLPPGADIFSVSTVGVQCRGDNSWTLYVPVKVKILETVVISLRPMSRGHQISRQDITLIQRDVAGLHIGYYNDPDKVVGKVLRRSVAINSVLGPGLLEKAQVIRRGEQVMIVAHTGGLEVRMMGQALMDGSEGELIRVRNSSSKQIVTGTVTGDGTVDVHL
jgi:flagella basal body P-ring formation protein FlgA